VLVQQVVVLRNVAIVEIGYAKIKQDIEQERKIENHKIETELGWTDGVLDRPVDPKDPEGLHQKVQEQQQTEVGKKFPLHVRENSGNILIFATKLKKYHLCLSGPHSFQSGSLDDQLNEDRSQHKVIAQGQA
jgi:hypothetical protein